MTAGRASLYLGGTSTSPGVVYRAPQLAQRPITGRAHPCLISGDLRAGEAKRLVPGLAEGLCQGMALNPGGSHSVSRWA